MLKGSHDPEAVTKLESLGFPARQFLHIDPVQVGRIRVITISQREESIDAETGERRETPADIEGPAW